MVAAVLHLQEGARVAFDAVDRMRRVPFHRHDVADRDRRAVAGPDRGSSFSSLPRTRSTSGMAANMAGSVCAAQPVTTMRASGAFALDAADALPRLAHRFRRHRAGVDHHGVAEARRAARRITSDSAMLSRQPKVTTSTLMRTPALREQRRIERAGEFEFDRPGHQHVIVAFAPVDGEIAARQRHLHLALGALEPRGGDRGRAGRRAAGLGQAGAALPGADDDVIARDDLRERDVGALGKDRMVLQQRPEACARS